MKVGIFDHVERADRPMATTLDERLTFAAAADAAGIYALHVAEHHATPLNLVPVPGVYLGALARATKRIRLGPLVYLLPLYSPLRLAEEICILDHLSHGRLEVGVGRGVSPFELGYHKVAHEDSRDIFIDAFDCMTAALANETFSYAGKHFTDAAVLVRLLQHDRGHLGRRARHAFRCQRADRLLQGQYRRLSRGAREAWRRGGAQGRIPRRRRGRSAAP